MKSLKELYKRGVGPSSSHTIAPARAVQLFLQRCPNADNYCVTLYGSLALTGKGHDTVKSLERAFFPHTVTVVCDKTTRVQHPNTMDFSAVKNGETVLQLRILSVGGGDIAVVGETNTSQEVYPHASFAEIKKFCKTNGLRFWQYAEKYDDGIFAYTKEMWQTMKTTAYKGLATEGVLPGGLGVVRRAKKLWETTGDQSEQIKQDRIVAAFAFALGEENADGGEIVTAPTCGSCGVVPAVFLYHQYVFGYTDEEIVRALLTAGIVGNVVKTNASVSGAECGCQAEIGTACAMAAAGLAELKNLSLDEIEYSAEVALEHHLGLTCDPVGGLVQIPCIERNAVAAMRAINAVNLATFLTESGKVSFDTVVVTMYETGKDLAVNYRETAEGGLAKHFGKC